MCKFKIKNEWEEIFSFAYQYLKELRFRFMWILIILAIGSVVSSFNPYVWGKIVDEIASGHLKGLAFWLIVYLVIAFFTLGFSFLETYLGSKLNYIAEAKLKEKLMKKVLYLRCKELDKFDTGLLVSRISSDAGEVLTFVIESITSFITIIVNIVAATFFVFQISVPLSIVSIMFIPLSVLSNIMFKKSFKFLNKLQKKYGDKISSFNVSTLGHVPEIKAYCLERERMDTYHDLISEGWSLEKKQIFLGNKVSLVTSIIGSTSMVVTLVLSAVLISNGKFTLGGMASFQRYISQLTGAVSSLLQMNYSAQSSIVAVNRINEMLSLEDEVEKRKKRVQKKSISRIQLDNVMFNYDRKAMVLNHCSLTIQSPGLYVLVGENGSGKSTVLKLIMRYYDIDQGQIILNDLPVNELPFEMVRRSVGYYSKETYIQNGTLRENLLLGLDEDSNAQSTDELLEICSTVGLFDFVQNLQDGLDTIVGENGKLLSSGQKQKIALARALLDTSEILLLDEITSDLDGDAEKSILSVLKQVSLTKIVLMVTHRIQSVTIADKIFVLDNGSIVTSGTHKELIKNSVEYQKLFQEL